MTRAAEVARDCPSIGSRARAVALGLLGLLLLAGPRPAQGHGVGAGGLHVLDWHSPHVSRVVSASYSWNDLGVTALGAAGGVVTIDGRRCLQGTQFGIDVDDEYGFDLDETVTLSLEIDLAASGTALLVAWDRNGGVGMEQLALPDDGDRGHRVELALSRARFAGRGDHGTDLLLAGQTSPFGFLATPQPLTICGLEVRRSFETPAPTGHGWLELEVRDEAGRPSPLRVGLYDRSGRMPIPSADAVEIKEFSDRTRTFLMRAQTVWPAPNRYVFYLDGSYRARVPAGVYRVVGTRGIEYRAVDETVEVPAGGVVAKTIRLERWADEAAAGWYSGDVHIHYARRDAADGAAALAQARAEDLNVANLLQMGNVAATHFPQLGWGPAAGRVIEGRSAVVSGQEDPRTSHRGHTIHLDLAGPVRFPDEYLLYHRVFEAAAAQGGVSGYAHANNASLGAEVGVALDAPFGLVRFLEVAQAGSVGTELWFALLDLGYRIAPAAGTDYPYLDHPGAVRTYVRIEGGWSVDGWFEGLEQGRAYVTNGPLLRFAVNGTDVGDTLRVSAGETLELSAGVSLNPDLDRLARVEILEQGEVVASTPAGGGSDQAMRLVHRASATHSTWFVVRAVGARTGTMESIAAVSAPVYVVVDGDQRTWKPEAVPGIVDRLVRALDALRGSSLGSAPEQEWWESGPVWTRTWEQQLEALAPRIEEARERLLDLARDAERATAR